MTRNNPPGDESSGKDDSSTDRFESSAGFRARQSHLPDIDVVIDVPLELVEIAREMHTILEEHGEDPKPFEKFLEDVALDQVRFELQFPQESTRPPAA